MRNACQCHTNITLVGDHNAHYFYVYLSFLRYLPTLITLKLGYIKLYLDKSISWPVPIPVSTLKKSYRIF